MDLKFEDLSNVSSLAIVPTIVMVPAAAEAGRHIRRPRRLQDVSTVEGPEICCFCSQTGARKQQVFEGDERGKPWYDDAKLRQTATKILTGSQRAIKLRKTYLFGSPT